MKYQLAKGFISIIDFDVRSPTKSLLVISANPLVAPAKSTALLAQVPKRNGGKKWREADYPPNEAVLSWFKLAYQYFLLSSATAGHSLPTHIHPQSQQGVTSSGRGEKEVLIC